MGTRNRLGRAITGALAICVIGLASPPLLPAAGSELEIPPPTQQGAVPLNPSTPPPLQSGQGNTLEVPLPRQFRGCWRGVVNDIDSLTMLNGPQIAAWVPKTYRICYVQSANGSFRPTISEAGMAANDQLQNVKGLLQVLSTDGRTSAQMRAYLRFDEAAPVSFGAMQHVGSVDELTNMTCQIENGTMHVQARVYGQWNGRPWWFIGWHTDFVNVPLSD